MSRTGKIARLPHAIRHQINLRLEECEGGQRLLNWINSLPEVQSLIVKDFASIPVTDGNLSEWRRGGYLDWLRVQQERDAVRLLREDSHIPNPVGGPRSHLGNHLSSVLTAEFAGLTSLILSKSLFEKWLCFGCAVERQPGEARRASILEHICKGGATKPG